MSSAEYKTIPAPRRIKKIKGIKGPEATLAKMVEELIAEQAAAGWDYVGTDTFPVEEKTGFFSSRETVLRGVMIFRRRHQMVQQAAAPQRAPEPAPYHEPEPYAPAPAPAPAPTMRAAPAQQDLDDDFIARPVGGARSD